MGCSQDLAPGVDVGGWEVHLQRQAEAWLRERHEKLSAEVQVGCASQHRARTVCWPAQAHGVLSVRQAGISGGGGLQAPTAANVGTSGGAGPSRGLGWAGRHAAPRRC